MRIGRLLGNALAGRPCEAFGSDAAVYVRSTRLLTYPDLSVVCGRLETSEENANAITNPIVLVEVLSPSTAAYDRGAKAMHYRRIESLQEYVLVATDEERLEVHRRNERGHWEIHEAGRGAAIELTSLDVMLDVDGVYFDPLAG